MSVKNGVQRTLTFKVTVTMTAVGQDMTFGAVEVSGLTNSSPLDQTNGNAASATTTPTTGGVTTTHSEKENVHTLRIHATPPD